MSNRMLGIYYVILKSQNKTQRSVISGAKIPHSIMIFFYRAEWLTLSVPLDLHFAQFDKQFDIRLTLLSSLHPPRFWNQGWNWKWSRILSDEKKKKIVF